MGFKGVVTGQVFHADRCCMRTLPEIWLLSPEIIDFCLGTARGTTSTSGRPGVDFTTTFAKKQLLGLMQGGVIMNFISGPLGIQQKVGSVGLASSYRP